MSLEEHGVKLDFTGVHGLAAEAENHSRADIGFQGVTPRGGYGSDTIGLKGQRGNRLLFGCDGDEGEGGEDPQAA